MDILRELFLGKVLPIEQLHPTSNEYKEAVKESIRLEKQLFEELDEKRAMLFNKFTKVEIDIGTEELLASFAQGFRLGVQLMAAAMREEWA